MWDSMLLTRQKYQCRRLKKQPYSIKSYRHMSNNVAVQTGPKSKFGIGTNDHGVGRDFKVLSRSFSLPVADSKCLMYEQAGVCRFRDFSPVLLRLVGVVMCRQQPS